MDSLTKALLGSITDLAEACPEPFLAPFAEAGASKVLTIQGGVPFWLDVARQEPGWWVVKPTSRSEAEQDRPAAFHDVARFLALLPGFNVLTIRPAGERTWLVVPLNSSDAAQRGWPRAMPRLAHLVPPGPWSALEVLRVRDFCGELYYERPGEAAQLRPYVAELRNRINAGQGWSDLRPNSDLAHAATLSLGWLAEREIARRKLAARAREAVARETIEHDLDIMGASLVSWQGGEVTFEHDGAVHTVTIDPNRKVLSAGICLGGTDQRHDLASIVHVMSEARRLHRFDLEEGLWR
jgi:hypothetical protein